MIAHGEARHALAQFLHHARALVAQHDGLGRVPAGMFVQVRMTNAGGDEADAHLARARRFLFQFDQLRRVAAPSGEGCGDLHAPSPR